MKTKTMKHIQGPWRVEHEVFRDGEMRVSAVSTERTNHLICDFDGSALPDEQNEANARLIAAAPELLEALEALVSATPTPKVLPRNVWFNALEVIKKATE